MSDQIKLMFSDISESYDLGNDVMTFGMHRGWKRKLVRLLDPQPGTHLLDLATGTGDIAFKLAARAGTTSTVVGMDFSAAMVTRARLRNTSPRITFEVGDAMKLRFEDDTFDCVTISYGIRNVDDPLVALEEMARVLRVGGRIGVLETGRASGSWGKMTELYSDRMVPFLGGLLSGNPDAYHYLNKSASEFPYGDNFVQIMLEAGFSNVRAIPLVGGISYIYLGEKSA